MNVEELDNVLVNLNVSAAAYEAYVIRSIEGEFNYDRFLEYVAQETTRLGESLANQILEYIFATIWCYANTPVEEGDIIAINPSKHAPHGVNMINGNPQLIGTYVLPLFLYGAEYYSTAHYLLFDVTIEPNDLFDVKNINPEKLLSSMLETALQARYSHISQCHLDMEIGSGELVNEQMGNIPAPVGKLVPAVDE